MRRIAYEPRLDLAIRAGEIMLFRGRSKLRPSSLNELGRGSRITSVTQRAQISSDSLGSQFAYTGGGSGGNWPSDDPRPPGSQED